MVSFRNAYVEARGSVAHSEREGRLYGLRERRLLDISDNQSWVATARSLRELEAALGRDMSEDCWLVAREEWENG